ncbi:uncharacterized protein LOC141646743 isoform X2 [Silene latifolia]|uniref:uncharacterized protein LOC141646743 isoform X2 n=1 Tax=Silene latifolia TaxID=37657 RepID=UPI003D78794F
MATHSINGVCINEITTSYLHFPKLCSPLSSLFTSTSPSASPFSYSYSVCNKVCHKLRVSSEGLPSNVEEEESKFVPINDEDPGFGPPAILLLGFGVEEADKIKQFLKDLEGEFLQVIYCTEDMITRSLSDALNSKQESLDKLKIAKSVPRLCFLSGLTGEEMMMFIDGFEETDLEEAVFAAHLPNNSNRPLQEVIDEVMGDHEMVSGDSEET